jgi:hypothetical protein
MHACLPACLPFLFVNANPAELTILVIMDPFLSVHQQKLLTS